MSLTVKEILEKTFNKSFRGYDEDEVDQFLDQIIDQMKALQSQNETLNKDLAQAKEKSAKIKETEDAIMHTLVSAQKSSERILKEAARKAELVIDNAENTARQRAQQAEKNLKEAERKLDAIKHSAQNFATSFAHMVNTQAASFDQAYQAYFGDLDTYSSGGINTEALERIDQDIAGSLEDIAPIEPDAPDGQPAAKPTKKGLEAPRFMIDETAEEGKGAGEQPKPEANEEKQASPAEPESQDIVDAAPHVPDVIEEIGVVPEQGAAEEADRELMSIAEEMTQPEASAEVVQAAPAADVLEVAPKPRGNGLMELHEINKALSDIDEGEEDILQDSYEDAPTPASESVSEAVETGSESADEVAEVAPEAAGETAETVSEAADEVAEAAPDAADGAKGEFKPKYDDYSWLYDNDNKADTSEFELSFKDPKEKEQLKSLIDEIID